MATIDPHVVAHLEWMGFVRPVGLVFSATALVRAGAILDRGDAEGQKLLRACVEQREFDATEGPAPGIPDFQAFAKTVLGWSFSPRGYAGTEESQIPPELELPLPDYGETLHPDFAVRERDPQDGTGEWQLLVSVLEPGSDFDASIRGPGGLDASAHGRMERLLRGTGVTAGLVFNCRSLRLISAPRGESSGYLDFHVADMLQTPGRPISSAIRLLLSERRLLTLPRPQRFAALLEDSRKYQNVVSEKLAEQVLHALYELLRGFQAAHDASGREMLRQPLSENPDEVYRGLLTTILRLVFLLYAEERDMLPKDETFIRYYSLSSLYEQLRDDAALYPDTMDQRFGAWARLLVLFRMMFDGAETTAMNLPQRHGVLFDPDRFPFLEGRKAIGARQKDERIDPPRVPDGTIYRALEKLLLLDGERISYRALDVEQIGSVYETMMGFRLETATGLSVAIKAPKKHGAPSVVDLEALLDETPAKREKALQDLTGRKLTSTAVKAGIKGAETVTDLHAALASVIDSAATPDLVPAGALVLQPSEERRRSGSHYTPRSLTEPIVRTTLEPILARLRTDWHQVPTPDAILDLKVCDPAMGSGAFLVESCRQLADVLVEAWKVHGGRPEIPADEDELVFARRLVAQRCLYGVDRNPIAVDLAKVSLWLVTLAKDHALTFLDHALRHGDSLVGLSREQIERFHWDTDETEFQPGLEAAKVREHVKRAHELRQLIREAGQDVADWELRDLWAEAQNELTDVRLFGDLVVVAFFEGSNPKTREARRRVYADSVDKGEHVAYADDLERRRHVDPPLAPFHWQVEFPEVFERENAGFDAFVGNPPFLGGSRISSAHSTAYRDWLLTSYPESRGKADLVAYFFRRTYAAARRGGTFGLIATNTIRQGDTRFTGLRWIRTHDGHIYDATRRLRWPGSAAVVVSVVHAVNGSVARRCLLDGIPVPTITAYLMPFGPDEDPARLAGNGDLALSGVNPNGKGFVLSATERDQMVERDSRASTFIRPYLGSSEMNESPSASTPRFIIALPDCDETFVQQYRPVYEHLEATVRLQRQGSAEARLRDRWWLFSRPADQLRKALESKDRVLVNGRVSAFHTFTFQPPSTVFSDAVTVFVFDQYSAFAALQAQTHEHWAQFQGSSFKDDPRYIPEDCFETFPFPHAWEDHPELEAAGREYYEFRAALMVRNHEGLTKTYNRFHDPNETEANILHLRDLHEAMDRAVLDAYGWTDISTNCEFLLDYEIDEEEAGSRRKKPWRYRWPDDVRDEVLARLLELNAERAAEEERLGVAPARKGPAAGNEDDNEVDEELE